MVVDSGGCAAAPAAVAATARVAIRDTQREPDADLTSITIDIHGRHDTHRLTGDIGGPRNLALMIDAAIKGCRDLWHPIEAHVLDHGGRAGDADFEPETWLNAGFLASSLMRTAAANGVSLDLIGADEPDRDAPDAHVALVQDTVQPRTVEVALQQAGVQQFQGRASDFLGWAKGG